MPDSSERIRNIDPSILDEANHPSIFARYPDEMFDSVRQFVMFVGCARSGHSVVAAVLDAHERVAIANELNALPLLEKYDDERCVYKLALESVRMRNDDRAWNNTGYDYNVAGSAQGSFRTLEVIGDKKAGATSAGSLKNPRAVDHVVSRFGDRLRIIHVVRNPWDNVAAIASRRKMPIGEFVIDRFFDRLRGALLWERALPASQFLRISHESVVADKDASIRRLCAFLELYADESYIARCAEMIYDAPNARRHGAEWPAGTRETIERRCASGEFADALREYVF